MSVNQKRDLRCPAGSFRLWIPHPPGGNFARPGDWECREMVGMDHVRQQVGYYVKLLDDHVHDDSREDIVRSMDRMFEVIAIGMYDHYLRCLGASTEGQCRQLGEECEWRAVPPLDRTAGGEAGPRCVPRGMRLDLGGPEPYDPVYASLGAMQDRFDFLLTQHPEVFRFKEFHHTRGAARPAQRGAPCPREGDA